MADPRCALVTDQRGDGAPNHPQAADEQHAERHRGPQRGRDAPEHYASRLVVPKFAQIYQILARVGEVVARLRQRQLLQIWHNRIDPAQIQTHAQTQAHTQTDGWTLLPLFAQIGHLPRRWRNNLFLRIYTGKVCLGSRSTRSH